MMVKIDNFLTSNTVMFDGLIKETLLLILCVIECDVYPSLKKIQKGTGKVGVVACKKNGHICSPGSNIINESFSHVEGRGCE